MKAKIKKLWVEALKSGDYTKGTHQLRSNGDRFCCLGVLCNLHAQAHPEIAAEQILPYRYLGESTFLPPEVQAWAGLKENNPVVKTGSLEYTLSYVNDNLEYDFPAIAKFIEKSL